MALTQMELFAGIGGFGLAGHWAGIETVCQVEIDPFCQKVLQKNFPNAKRYADVKKFDGKPWRGTVDIISGGFPCQPYSNAGKRLGKEDERHLWPEMLRVIREVRPRWIVGENVFGLINWSEGLVFNEVQSDLESEGYEVWAFVLPAAAVNAPHRRDRVWFVAYAGNNGSITAKNGQGLEQRNDENKAGENEAEQFAGRSGADAAIVAYAHKIRFKKSKQKRCSIKEQSRLRASISRHVRVGVTANAGKGRCRREKGKIGKLGRRRFSQHSKRITWNETTLEPPICGVDDGVPAGLDKNRNKRIGALGNAIVPQVAYRIFKSIMEYENGHNI